MSTMTEIQKSTIATIATADLRDALVLARKCMQKSYRSAIPVLKMVRISTGRNGGSITATDLDREIETSFAVDGFPVDFLIQPHILGHFLQHGGPSIEISIEPGQHGRVIVLKTGELTGRINEICPVEDFPPSLFETKKGFDCPQTIDATAFRYALDAAAVTISTEETRYYLNGIFFEPVDGHLRMVSTDGHRLTQVDCPDIPWERDGLILPRVTVAQLRKDLKGVDKIQIAYSADATCLRIVTPKWSLITKLIDGTFPNYRRVIPQNVDGSFSVALTGDALAAFPRMGDSSTALHIVPEESRMFVKAHDLGEVSMPLHGAKGVKCGVNINYLKALCPRGEAIRLVGRNPKKDTAGFIPRDSVTDPILVMGADENVLRVVMPMRV